jgi:hypothetical protein
LLLLVLLLLLWRLRQLVRLLLFVLLQGCDVAPQSSERCLVHKRCHVSANKALGVGSQLVDVRGRQVVPHARQPGVRE